MSHGSGPAVRTIGDRLGEARAGVVWGTTVQRDDPGLVNQFAVENHVVAGLDDCDDRTDRGMSP